MSTRAELKAFFETGDVPTEAQFADLIDSLALVIHAHAGEDITSGIVAPARLGIGSDIETKFLRGDGVWITLAGETPPGGSATQVQFNSDGVFGGTANVTYDGTRLNAHTGSSQGVVIGELAGITGGSTAVCIGYQCGADATAAEQGSSTNVGRHAGYRAKGGDFVCIGHAAGQYATSCAAAVIIGYEAARNLPAATVNCFDSIVVGHNTAKTAVTFYNSVMIGSNAGLATPSAFGAVIIGDSAYTLGGTGNNSVVVGRQAGGSITGNSANSVIIGYQAGQSATTATGCVYVGYGAGKSLVRANSLVIDSNQTYATGNTALIYGEFDNRLIRFGADTVKCQKDLILETDQTPASASATGTKGMIRWDADYVYICTATNTWKRAAIATW